MCHYITLVVGGLDADDVLGVMTRHGRIADVIANPSIQRVLRQGETQFVTTRSCDCGTALAREERPASASLSTARLASRGWSQAKIDRWLEGKTKTELKKSERRAVRGDSTEYWAAIVRDLQALGPASVGVFLHFYSSGIETEIMDMLRQERRQDDSLESQLAALPEDTLVML